MINNACNKMIGIYVAAASLLCILAMAADAFQAFRLKRLWFPCKFFALNAASLTVLAVAMKLPVDISEPMPGHTDQLSILASTAFMCVVLGNFMPSIGAMSNKEILSNVVALDILGPNYHQSEPEHRRETELHHYVLLLEGEELPERIFKNISDIYCHQVPVLHSVEPSNCWTLSLVTLTSITVALPKVRDQMDYQLIRSVHEGLTYASFIEETMYPEGEFRNIRNAAHIVWEELEIHQKWLDEDLQKPTLEGKTTKETLEMLTGIASK
ncbi:hypothetical protein H5410_043444 [Solanum commersonii]|uniref:Uncharacterized protein n=1 Tax=Solanum commersonii TaxID=4109 RepID=A0A9J5XYW2_SOLCO|nr:hypothetical protein H5410_043444 [Solanum commersonii]